MGEDWAASSPFQFFVDFPGDPDLQKAVRDGRRREFAKFVSFGGADEVPDPTDAATFRRSRIDWDERRRAPHAGVLLQTAELLALRREYVLPLIRSRFLGGAWEQPHDAALAVDWRFSGGRLRFIANFGDDVVEVCQTPGEHVIWKSSEAVEQAETVHLNRWTGIVLTYRERR
jgi:maltooligosyltrehalose trehalohydrolase